MARCYICDTILGAHEVVLKDSQLEQCTKCTSVVNDIVQEDALLDSQLGEFEQYVLE